jgi:hypothetical protein
MSEGRYEQEEYLEQNDEEAETAVRTKKLVVLGVMAILLVAGVVLAHKLNHVSRVEDCLLAHGSNCDEPPTPANPVR